MPMPKGAKKGPDGKMVAPSVSSPSTSKAPAPVREQIKNLAGMSKEELAKSVPETTAGTIDDKPKRGRKPSEPIDPLMQDERYRKAIGNMTAFGGKRVIKSGFQAAALVAADKDIALSQEEEENWDDYFYVVAKKSNIDPARPWILAITGVMMLFEQIIVRLFKNGTNDFTKQIGEFFGFLEKEAPKEEVKQS